VVTLKIGLVGPTFDERSLPFDAQRTINFFPVLDPMGKEPAALYSVPGLSLFSDTGSVQGTRGMFASLTGRAYTVVGNND